MTDIGAADVAAAVGRVLWDFWLVVFKLLKSFVVCVRVHIFAAKIPPPAAKLAAVLTESERKRCVNASDPPTMYRDANCASQPTPWTGRKRLVDRNPDGSSRRYELLNRHLLETESDQNQADQQERRNVFEVLRPVPHDSKIPI